MSDSKIWDLFLACNRCNINNIQKILDEGIDIHSRNSSKLTPLHAVSYFKNETSEDKQKCLDVIRLLINRGANIESVDEIGNTPLLTACWEGNVVMAIELIDKGANVNAKNIGDMTALHYITNIDKNINVVKRLLEEGADVNAKTKWNCTPLSFACERIIPGNLLSSCIEMVKLLLSRGANMDDVDMTNLWVLHRHTYIELFKKEKRLRLRRKIVNMRFVSNYWRRIEDNRRIQNGEFIIGGCD
jgi:ankyrin repeat protein